MDALRHAAICALDLGNKPLAIDDHVLFVEIKLKFEHANLPPNKKYEPVAGFIMSMEETTGLLSRLHFCLDNSKIDNAMFFPGQNGGAEILDGVKAANLHMRQKGGLGVATILMKAHDVVDVVKVLLPSPTAAKIAQAADDWGEFWVCPTLHKIEHLFSYVFMDLGPEIAPCCHINRRLPNLHTLLIRDLLNGEEHRTVSAGDNHRCIHTLD